MDDLIHPIAEIFPLIEGDEFEQLKADIKANGIQQPIWLYEGKIIDGRNRFNACEALGVTPDYREYTGTNPLEFALSLNLHRRHLSESQRAMVAVKLSTFKHGGDRVSESANLHLDPNAIGANLHLAVSRKEAAEKLNVSPRTVATAAKVKNEGTAELAKAVEKGQVTVNAAAALVDLPEDEQRALVAAGVAEIKKAASTVRKTAKHQDANDSSEALDQAHDAIQALTERNAELEAENKALRMAADPAVLTRVEELHTRIKTIESQRNDYQTQCNELKKEVKRLQSQVRRQNG